MSDAVMQALQRIEAGQARVEAKLAELLNALAEENGDAPEARDLEGQPAGRERDQSRSLDEG
jgi:hypothetical protein